MISANYTYVIERKVKEDYWLPVSYIRCNQYSARFIIDSVVNSDPDLCLYVLRGLLLTSTRLFQCVSGLESQVRDLLSIRKVKNAQSNTRNCALGRRDEKTYQPNWMGIFILTHLNNSVY